MLILDGISFELESETRDSAFFVFESDEGDGLEYAVDCLFKENDFRGEEVSPGLCINCIETTAKSIPELVGESYSVENIEQSDEREDTLYIYEHEPMESYHITVLEIKNDKAHIKCEGVAIIDGYAECYETAQFSIDCWLPVITEKEDWERFGL